MAITDYQAKYLAYELTKRCASDSEEKLAATVAGAQVDLNPHQVDVALFAFQSPLSKGAIMADVVGLGNTLARKSASSISISLFPTNMVVGSDFCSG